MKMFFAFLAGVILTISHPALAQTADEEFCALAPIDMLVALDGNWTLNPGAGVVGAGGMVIPVPAQAPQPLTFTYNPDSASITIVDGTTKQEFILVPTTPEAGEIALGIAKDWSSADFMKMGAGCDWYSMPLMIATTAYSLNGEVGEMKNIVSGVFGPLSFSYCPFGNYGNPNVDGNLSGDLALVATPKEVYIDGKPNATNPAFTFFEVGYDGSCEKDPNYDPTPAEGDLIMNLVVKFQSPTSGTGVLYFDGEMNGFQAIAVRPVTLSR